MSIANRILAIVLSLGLLLLIFELIRRKKLKERYAILWFFTGSAILVFAVFQNILLGLTTMLGIIMPINAMLFLGIFFIILINIHFSLVISDLSEQNKILARKVAMMELDIENIQKKKTD